MFQNAKAIIDIIEQRKNRGNGLAHFQKYMESIGSPHLNLRSIHVAGTNGKGSTTNDIRSILQVAGYQVGTFTSPYMITHLDRIRINDVYISKTDFLAIVNEYYDSWMTWDLSMFEIDMCIACVYFTQKQVDYCVFEVGLGGRLDMTNILEPMVSVITNIGLDHMELLGDTYEKIAFEKAGIIKDKIPLFTAEQKESCLQVFKQQAKEKHTKCYAIQELHNIHLKQDTICFDYRKYKEIILASGARYQCANAALTIDVVLYLHNQGLIHVTKHHIYEGLRKAEWIGRYEIIEKNPLVLLDGAHNSDGIHALCESIKHIPNPIIIFSVLKDKNFEDMIKELKRVSDTIMLCQLQHNERALDVHQLDAMEGIIIEEGFMEAFAKAKAMKRAIVITGSLYFVSDVRAILCKENTMR